ncbi:hypothetical protein [Sporolactobacillus sp. CQH2019]|uniref:hypothetical protein n=1 Tax=Sporolactobacillus sp. CQH2019 TaxID=3023512 RepID=UPI002368D9B8|nr:hypothetical protein [Sporolactobacillus sp. CQH2019]
MENPLQINKIEVPVVEGKIEIDTSEGGKFYIVSQGKATMYPLPEYGTVKIKSHGFSVDHPEYTIFADN